MRSDFEPPRTTDWLRLGPISLRPSFAIRDLGRDTNVFLSRDDPTSAWTATLTPAVEGAVRFGARGFLTAKLGGDYVWYSPVSVEETQTSGATKTVSRDLSHTNLVSVVKGNLSLSSLRLFASADYQRHEERPNNELDERAQRVNLLQRAGVGYEYSPRTALDTIAARERITYSDADFESTVSCPDSDGDASTRGPCAPNLAAGTACRPTDTDGDGTADACVYGLDDLLTRVETSATLRFSQRILGRTRLVFDAQTKRYEFQGELPAPGSDGRLPLVGPLRDASETRLMAGFELEPGGGLSGGFRAGTIDFEPRRGPARSQRTSEAIWSGSVNWRILGRLSLTTALDRDLHISTFGDNLYFRQDHAGQQCVYYLNRVVGLEVGYDGYRLVYPTPTLVTDSQTRGRRRDRIRTLRGGLRIKLANRTVATLRVADRARTSNIPGSEDSQVLLTTGVETTF